MIIFCTIYFRNFTLIICNRPWFFYFTTIITWLWITLKTSLTHLLFIDKIAKFKFIESSTYSIWNHKITWRTTLIWNQVETFITLKAFLITIINFAIWFNRNQTLINWIHKRIIRCTIFILSQIHSIRTLSTLI